MLVSINNSLIKKYSSFLFAKAYIELSNRKKTINKLIIPKE